MLLLLFPAFASAFAAQPPVPGSAPAPPAASEPDNAAVSGNWVDRTHTYFLGRIDNTIDWFDAFFGTTAGMDAAQPDFVMRWTNEVRVEEMGRLKYRTSLRANIHLPKISRKLKLVISGENKPDPSAVLPADPGNPGFNVEAPNISIKQVNTEIRYELRKTEKTYFFAGTGVRLILPPEAFARIRYQWNRSFLDNYYFRFAVTPFWNSRVRFGETTEFSMERRILPSLLAGWSASGTISDESNGLEWGSSVTLNAQVTPKTAVSPSAGLSGPTRPVAVVTNYRAAVKFRRNEFRPWFFWELEPEVNWPRDGLGGHKPAYAGTIRAEILFLGR